jgi:hypothetical protein
VLVFLYSVRHIKGRLEDQCQKSVASGALAVGLLEPEATAVKDVAAILCPEGGLLP